MSFDEYNCDVLVIGGGPAGTAAAIAAARQGAKVLLAEAYGYLGGMATAGLVILHYEADKAGLSLELIERMKKLNGWGSEQWPTAYSADAWKYASERMALEAGVKLLYHSYFYDVEMEKDRIKCAWFHTKQGPLRCTANIYIDGTGDGDVAYMAKVPFVKGDETGAMQPTTLMFVLKNVTYQQGHEAQLYADIEKAKKQHGVDYNVRYNRPWAHTLAGEGRVVMMYTHIHDIDSTNSWDLTRAEIDGREQIYEAVDFLKKYIPGFENAEIEQIANCIGTRESRHFEGEYKLSQADLDNDTQFEDVVACCRFPIDIHQARDGGQINIPLAKPFGIPYRSLLPRGCKNLLLSGRNISSTCEPHASFRVKGVCMAIGQAGGVAAGLAIRNKTSLRDVNVAEMQEVLRKSMQKLGREDDLNKVIIPNFPSTCDLDVK